MERVERVARTTCPAPLHGCRSGDANGLSRAGRLRVWVETPKNFDCTRPSDLRSWPPVRDTIFQPEEDANRGDVAELVPVGFWILGLSGSHVSGGLGASGLEGQALPALGLEVY